jgi:hypothetical protein
VGQASERGRARRSRRRRIASPRGGQRWGTAGRDLSNRASCVTQSFDLHLVHSRSLRMTAPDNIPEIISAAAQSRLGMLALLVILLAAVGYGLFRKAAESTRLVIFSMLFVGVCGFGVAVLRADSQGSPPAPNESRSNAKKSRPIHGNAAGKSADQNGIALDAGNKAEGTKPADKSARAGPTIEKDSAVGSQRDSAPLDFSDIKVGGKYIITDRFGHKDSIQAPLYNEPPRDFRRLHFLRGWSL